MMASRWACCSSSYPLYLVKPTTFGVRVLSPILQPSSLPSSLHALHFPLPHLSPLFPTSPFLGSKARSNGEQNAQPPAITVRRIHDAVASG